jgi:hypothetical protein
MRTLLAAAMLIFPATPAFAEDRGGGKLLLTEGVTSIEGAAGGGLATWATIAGRETDAGVGGSLHITHVPLKDFTLTSFGGAIGFYDRVELSFAHQSFDTREAGAALGLGKSFTFGQSIFGAKVRLFGDAVYDQDRALPQVSVGVQHKIAKRAPVIAAVGGKARSGTDFYIAATKVLLAQSTVVNVTLRATKANQTGLLGFGGDGRNAYTAQVEASAGVLLARNILVGAEFRSKPSNLRFAREDDACDAFVAWSPVRHLTVTAAYADLGSIATIKGQRGAFLSLQSSF